MNVLLTALCPWREVELKDEKNNRISSLNAGEAMADFGVAREEAAARGNWPVLIDGLSHLLESEVIGVDPVPSFTKQPVRSSNEQVSPLWLGSVSWPSSFGFL
jgi:hypothetical protein